MKSVLLSVQPKWCELIANGSKTIEVRKTRPKIDNPFKVYIYCTKPKGKNDFGLCLDKGMSGNLKNIGLFFKQNYETALNMGMDTLSGKVIGEFICNRIQEYESEFVDDDCYESIASFSYDEDGDVTGFIEWSNDCDFSYEHIDLYEDSCVSYEELKKYI